MHKHTHRIEGKSSSRKGQEEVITNNERRETAIH